MYPRAYPERQKPRRFSAGGFWLVHLPSTAAVAVEAEGQWTTDVVGFLLPSDLAAGYAASPGTEGSRGRVFVQSFAATSCRSRVQPYRQERAGANHVHVDPVSPKLRSMSAGRAAPCRLRAWRHLR
jgi:hypothetical protein